jgi:alkylation response protein AidB-like acyl-CoA dehydrogenase
MTDLDQYRADMKVWLEAHLLRRAGQEARGVHEIAVAEVARSRERQRMTYDAGYLGITVPVEYGGQGLTPEHQRVWDEESAAFEVPLPGGVASGVTMNIILPVLLAHCSEEQKRGWIPKLLAGEEIWCQLLSEPGAGSDLAGLLTRATRDGDSWVLNGAKVWSSGALAADYGICLARTDWDVPKHRGLTWFKVPLHHPNVTVRPVREINGGAAFCEEFLDDVSVGNDMVIGEVDGGWAIANHMLGIERTRTGQQAANSAPAGSARSLPEDLVALADVVGLTRDGAARQLVARVHVNAFVHEQLTRRVMAIAAAGANPATASLVKLNVGINDPIRAHVVMEVAGRAGLAWRGDGDPGQTAATNFLNGRIYSIAGGSNQIQRNIIAERLLGLPREPSSDGDRPFRDVLRDAKEWGSRKQ